MTLIYGDSLTSGENNDFTSYVNYLGLEDYKNYAVSGTTIGNYSLYPVDKFSLYSIIEKQEEMGIFNDDIDRIILAYGVNDITAAAAGNVTFRQVIYALNKVIDLLHQLVPDAEIIYILPTNRSGPLNDLCDINYKYLKDNYLKNYHEFADPETFWDMFVSTYFELQRYLLRTFSDRLIYMIEDVDFYKKYIDTDEIHPNDEGYKKIAKNIKKSNIIK